MAKKHKPTEGEWTQEYDGTVCMAGQCVIMQEWLGPEDASEEERTANGRYICASKPAIKALRMLMKSCTREDGSEKAWAMAREALNIAEGKSWQTKTHR